MTERDRRALRLGLGIVLAGVLALRIAPWAVRQGLALRRDLANRVQLLSRARAEVAGAHSLQDSVTGLTQAIVALAPRLVGSTTAAEAEATLAGLVQSAASRHALRVDRTDAVPDTLALGRLRRARAHLILEGDVRGLVGFVRAIETTPEALTLDALRVVAADPGATRGPEVLRIEVTVTGRWVETGSGERKTASVEVDP